MKNNFLVLLCGHVDSEEKKNLVLETLDGFEKEGIDVCYSTHTPNYLDEISKKVKFTVFDSNNQFLTKHDYIENIDLLENLETYGCNSRIQWQSFGVVKDDRCGPPHSRSALSLLKNGTIISQSNSYKWTIYIEYDLKPPIKGYKNYLENKISLLEKENLECLCYKRDDHLHAQESYVNLDFINGNLFIFKTDNIFSNSKFMKEDWYSSSRNWISNWKLGFFETIIENIISTSFDNSRILMQPITKDSLDFWGDNISSNMQKHNSSESYFVNEKTLEFGLFLELYPSKRNDVYDLHLYIDYSGSEGLLISNIIVRNDQQILFKIDELYPNVEFWYIWTVEYNDSKKVTLEYTLSNKTYTKNYSLNYNLEYIEIMYNNLCRIEFN